MYRRTGSTLRCPVCFMMERSLAPPLPDLPGGKALLACQLPGGRQGLVGHLCCP